MKLFHVTVGIVILAAVVIVAVVVLRTEPEQPVFDTARLDTPTALPEATTAPEAQPTYAPTPPVSEQPPEQPAVAGYVIDMSGQPIAGVAISASGTQSTARSDLNGNFTFAAVEGVTTTLHVDQPPYVSITLKGLDLPTEDAVFVLFKGGQIRGRVTSLLSRPVEGVTIEMNSSGGPQRNLPKMVKAAAGLSPPDAPWRSVLERVDEEAIASVCALAPYKLETAVTGPDGRYSFDRLRSGKYTLRVKHETLTAEPHDQVLVDWEEMVDGIDFELASGYYIRGKAYEVKSEATVAGVTVSHQVTRQEAVTLHDGTYELGPLPPGHFRLRVQTPPEYVLADVSLGSRGPETNVTDQDIEDVDIKLEKAGLLRGRVINAAGQPVPKAQVSLALQSLNPMDFQRIGRVESLLRGRQTDEQGRFELDRVPEGRGYVLYGAAEGYAAGQFGPFDLGYGETKEDIEIVLSKGGTVVGRILDQNGDPVPEYTVFCLPGDNFFSTIFLLGNDELRKTGKSSKDGRYEVEGVPEGKNVVMLYRKVEPRPSGMPKSQKTVDVTATTQVDFTIDVAKLDGVISGRVVTSKGQPAQGVAMLAMTKNMAMVNQEGGRMETGTDQNGEYTLEDLLVETDYVVLAMEVKGEVDVARLFSDAASQTAKTSAENVDFVLPGRGGISGRVVYKLTGRPVPAFSIVPTRITEEENPLGGMSAILQGIFGGGQGKEFSSRDGSFVLRDLIVGTYNLEASGEGFAKTTREGILVIEDQTTEDVVIEVEGGGGIEGVVRDAGTKTPIEDALVTVQPGGTGAMFALLGFNFPQRNKIEATTGADGKFSITGLDEGHVTLKVTNQGYASETVGPVAVPSKGMQTVQVVLAKGGRIEGHVYDTDSNPLPGTQLTIFALDGSNTVSVTADEKGFYWKDSVSEGHYIVGFSFMDIFGSDHQGSLQGRGEVRNGETTVIDVGGPGGTTVVGTVRRAGQPVAGVEIIFVKGPEGSIFLPGGMLSQVTTDADGNYRATSLPGGQAKLLVTRLASIFQGRPPEILYRQEIQLPESGEIQIPIDLQLSTLAGSVRDAETGEPVEGAFLMLYPDLSGPDRQAYELRPGADGEMGALQATTSSDGRYEFPDVDPRKYVLTCRAEGYGQQAVEVSVEPAPSPDIDFTLPKQVGELIGRITDRVTGRAVPSAVGYLIDQHGQMIMPAESGPMGMMADESGRIRIDSVAPGAYALVCGDPMGGAYAWHRTEGVVVLAGQPTEVEVQLDRGAAVVLSLVDPQGQPLVGAEWKLFDGRGTSLAGQMIQFGNIMRSSLAPGQYTAQAELPGFQPREFTFVIEEGQATFEAPVVVRPL